MDPSLPRPSRSTAGRSIAWFTHPPAAPAPQGNGAFAPGAGFGRSAPMGAPPLSLYGAPASQPPPSAALNGGFGPGLGAAAGGLLSGLGLGFGGGGGAGALGLPFDPAAAPSIDKLNAAFAARQQQLLGGGAFLLPRT